MRLATATAPPLPIAAERNRIVKFLQTRSDGAIRQARGQRDGRDSATPQGPRFDRRPTPPATLVQIVEQFDILALNGFYDCRILHDAIMTSTADSIQAQFR